MQVWTGLDQVSTPQPTVVTIGNFDGMHQGHTRVIESCVERARKLGCRSVAITFDPHPRKVHHPECELSMVMSLSDRLEIMAVTGLDATLVAPYGPELYSLTAEEFVHKYLIEGLGAVEVVVGEDFRFGKHNSGDIDTLRQLGRAANFEGKTGFEVAMVTDIEDSSGRRWSSSWVRELLEQGDVEGAARVLGRFHRLTGTVQHGAKRGRQLGFPTANLSAESGLMAPADGVYSGWLVRDVYPQTATESGTQMEQEQGHVITAQEFLPAAISVGSNPQFSGVQRTVEAHVLGRSDLDLYGEMVTVVFVKRLRSMQKFASVDALLHQMDEDLRRTAATLGVRTAGRVDPSTVVAGQNPKSS